MGTLYRKVAVSERWAPMPNFEKFYEVSNFGNVRSKDRLVLSKNGTKRLFKGKDLTLSLNNIKYFTICAKIREMGANKTLTVHRLVALAFIPNPENKPQVNHINGIKTDNRVENLEWVTATENLNHAFKMGLLADKNAFEYPNTTLTRDQVLEIRELFKTKTNKEIAHKYNVSKEIISKLKNGRTYKNIG